MKTDVYRKNAALIPRSWYLFKVPGGRSVRFCCKYGHIGTLDDHVIHADGMVVPSVWCAEPGCDFHEQLRLEGWTGA